MYMHTYLVKRKEKKKSSLITDTRPKINRSEGRLAASFCHKKRQSNISQTNCSAHPPPRLCKTEAKPFAVLHPAPIWALARPEQILVHVRCSRRNASLHKYLYLYLGALDDASITDICITRYLTTKKKFFYCLLVSLILTETFRSNKDGWLKAFQSHVVICTYIT